MRFPSRLLLRHICPGLEIEAGCHDHLHPKWADLTTAQRIEIIHASAMYMGAINPPKRKDWS